MEGKEKAQERESEVEKLEEQEGKRMDREQREWENMGMRRRKFTEGGGREEDGRKLPERRKLIDSRNLV